MEAVVEYDYTAREMDELSMKKGDIIKDIIDRGGGWCEGMLANKRGMFPDNFVRIINKDITYRNKKDISRIRQCRVIFSYKQDHEDELNLNIGDIVDLIGEEEEGWWRGMLNGKEGVFPSNFVEEINIGSKLKHGSKENLDSAGELDPKTPSLPPKPVKILCEVKYGYKAQNGDELSFKEGDIITLISKEGQDPGWWKGELNGQMGVFPDNFVIIIPSSEENSVQEEKKTEKAAQEATPKRQKPVEKLDGDSISKVTPPVPGKKPLIPIKKSPSGSSSSGGLFSGLKKKIVDAVDGAASSKSYNLNKTSDLKNLKHEDNTTEHAFDQVERNALLSDVRATRVKAPGRRPPSVVFKEGEPGVVNGNSEHLALDVLSENLLNHTSNEQDIFTEVKPKVREWEKHKAPWLAEMKLNQAKRTSTSPGSDNSKLKLTPDLVDEESKSCKVSPFETPSPIDMSKSMPTFTSRLKTPPNELEKGTTPMLRTKPIQSVSIRPQTIHTMGGGSSNDAPIPSPSKPVSTKISPNITSKLTSPIIKSQLAEKTVEKASGDIAQDIIPIQQYAELFQRLEKLEAIVEQQEKQNQANKAAIEDLRGKLQVETDMRMLLQAELEKVSQCVTQV